MTDWAKKTAEILLSIKAVEVNPTQPFTYASGLRGPIYCDNRKLLSYPKERSEIKNYFVELIEEKGLSFDHLAGLATAGIPHASFIADAMNRSMVYIRSKPKGHGRRNQIEGAAKDGDKLLLVEDLVNQGASLNEALLGVKDAGLMATDCLAIVTYQSAGAEKILKEWDLGLHTLTDFDTICHVAAEKDLIEESKLQLLLDWRKDPKLWSENFS